MSEEIEKIALRLGQYLDSMADGAAPTEDLFRYDEALWWSARAYQDWVLVVGYLRILLTDNPAILGPLGPILSAMEGNESIRLELEEENNE